MDKKVMAYEKAYTVGGDTRWFVLGEALWNRCEEGKKLYLFAEESGFVLLAGNAHEYYVYESILDKEGIESFLKAANKLEMELKC